MQRSRLILRRVSQALVVRPENIERLLRVSWLILATLAALAFTRRTGFVAPFAPTARAVADDDVILD